MLISIVMIALNWIGSSFNIHDRPLLPDGPATVGVTAAGAIGAFAAAAVALWGSIENGNDARRARAETVSVRDEVERREERRRHEDVRPIINVRMTLTPTGQLDLEIFNHGHRTAFGVYFRLENTIRLPSTGAYFTDPANPWPSVNQTFTHAADVLVPFIFNPAGATKSYANLPLPFRPFDFYLIYRDTLFGWWIHKIRVNVGGATGLVASHPVWVDLDVPTRIPPRPLSA